MSPAGRPTRSLAPSPWRWIAYPIARAAPANEPQVSIDLPSVPYSSDGDDRRIVPISQTIRYSATAIRWKSLPRSLIAPYWSGLSGQRENGLIDSPEDVSVRGAPGQNLEVAFSRACQDEPVRDHTGM
jgi:hypothetical protein